MGSTIAMLRQCETCKQVKSVTQMFTRIGKTNNYYAVCKACRAYAKSAEIMALDPHRKVCTKCGASKSYREFGSLGGLLRPQCMQCVTKAKRLSNSRAAAPVVAPQPKVTSNPWENLGLEWRNGTLRDPYSQSNRYD